MAGLFQPQALIGGAPVLPDDRGMDGFAGLPVPDDGGFALVGDADRGNLLSRNPRRDDVVP
jgi:hypothetical protein